MHLFTAPSFLDLKVVESNTHLSTTHFGGFTLTNLIADVKQESSEYQFL